jgi:hypothetical protein
MGGGYKERGVLINEKPNQGVRERKRLGTAALDDRTRSEVMS